MKDITSCPLCGGKDLISLFKDSTISVPYGPKINYIQETVVCLKCKRGGFAGFVGDETSLEAAIKQSTKFSITVMLNKLFEEGYREIYIERIFRLPFGCLSKWQDGEYTPEGVAFLKLLCDNPTLITRSDA